MGNMFKGAVNPPRAAAPAASPRSPNKAADAAPVTQPQRVTLPPRHLLQYRYQEFLRCPKFQRCHLLLATQQLRQM